MINQQLIDYIRKKLATGASQAEIAQVLLKNGWTKNDLAEAFSFLAPKATPQGGVPAVPAPARLVRPAHTGRKLLLSFTFILASAAYTAWAYMQAPAAPTVAAQNAEPVSRTAPIAQAPQQTAPEPSPQSPVESTPPPTPAPTPTPTPAPVPTPKPKPSGQYVDGSYTGRAADAYYGTVQVRATVSSGKLADVVFLQYPNDRSTSRYINSQAMPVLTSEAIQAQSANVDVVSGATDTSDAFRQSLASALTKARS